RPVSTVAPAAAGNSSAAGRYVRILPGAHDRRTAVRSFASVAVRASEVALGVRIQRSVPGEFMLSVSPSARLRPTPIHPEASVAPAKIATLARVSFIVSSRGVG